MKYLSEVPEELFRLLCERQHHPVCCVTEDHRFFWVNEKLSETLGYSRHELINKTWMSVTVPEDVGGDLASAEDLISGRRTHYSMDKRYIHKLGQAIPGKMHVYRVPPSRERFICFAVEFIPYDADLESAKQEQKELNQQSAEMLAAMAHRIEKLEREKRVNGNSNNNESSSSPIINIGGNQGTVIAIVLLIILSAFGYLALERMEKSHGKPQEIHEYSP